MHNDVKELQNAKDSVGIRRRLWQVILSSAVILIIGLTYGVFVKITGIAIPCVFYRVTGLKCPGCGVTRMCVALLQFRWREAWNCHSMLMIQLPFLGLIAMRNVIAYIKKGFCRVSHLETTIIYICIVLLVGFTMFRNIVGV